MARVIATLLIVAAAVVLLNVPFGFWRAGTRRFTLPWILAVHVPVPFVVALRLGSGLGWKLYTFPVMIGAYFTGQFLGGRVRLSRERVRAAATASEPLSPQ